MRFEAAQQTDGETIVFSEELIVCWYHKNSCKLYTIINSVKLDNGKLAQESREINYTKSITVSVYDFTLASDPESLMDPRTSLDLESYKISLTKEGTTKIWNSTYTTLTKVQLLFFKWHKRIRHFPQTYIRRYPKQGCMLNELQHVKKMPLYPVYCWKVGYQSLLIQKVSLR